MFRVRWEETALNELAALWLAANAALRQAITTASSQIDQLLQTDPLGQSESRPDGRRILFVSPLGITFRIEEDGETVSVLRIWLFRRRGQYQSACSLAERKRPRTSPLLYCHSRYRRRRADSPRVAVPSF